MPPIPASSFRPVRTGPRWEARTARTYYYVAATNRPLNQYAQNVNVFHCPADKGDLLHETTNCFNVYGNSYLVEWADPGNPVDPGCPSARYGYRTRSLTAAQQPMKTSDFSARVANKHVQGDWVWHGNRGDTDPKSVWHNFRGTSLCMMLYADGHVKAYKFPPDMVNWIVSPPPDPNFLWW